VVVSGTTAGASVAPGQAPVVVIGAGMAGLAAAVTLQRAGRTVCVLEAGDGPGGRVRSDHSPDGFLLDRGFQVLFTAYPALDGLINQPGLRLHAFDSGALIAGSSPMQIAVDPFAHPRRLLQLLTNSPFSRRDALRLLRLKLELMGPGGGRLPAAGEHSAATELAASGFSESAVERFFRPFFGGVLLDRGLSARAQWFLFTFKMLSEGKTAVPGDGMGALAADLAAQLPAGAIHLNTAAAAIERDATGRVSAVCAAAQRFPASAVILAADIWSARSLAPDLPTFEPLGCTTIYFAGSQPLYQDRLIVLNPDPAGFLNEVVQITNVAPSYAPPGQHLLSCTSLVAQHLDEATIERCSRAELQQWFGSTAASLRCLAIYRLPHAQFRQPPHWRERRPNIRPSTPGLYLAGEYMQSSSIQGALRSGVEAARAVMGQQGRPPGT
jgi:phytoene dehydrogenase-like protein